MNEPLNIERLDFSEFHDLMHLPFTKHCRSMYGGPRNHLSMAWKYKWKRRIQRAILCRLGRHDWGDGWCQHLGDCLICGNCWHAREK